MTLTVSRLRSWSPESLPGAADDLQATHVLLLELQSGVCSAVGAMSWESPAADAARAAAEDLARALQELGASFDLQAETVRRAAAAVQAAQTLLSDGARLAGDHGLTMFDDGSVSAVPPVMHAADLTDAELRRIADGLQAANEARVKASAMAREALASAAEADRDAATALRSGDGIGALLAGIAPGAGGFLGLSGSMRAYAELLRADLLDAVDGRAVPERGSDPHEVNAWWASLPPGQQRALAASSPELLGQLDGLPATVRDAANRARLAGERAALEAEAARLKRNLDENLFGGAFTHDDARLDDVLGKLAALDTIEKVLAPPAQDRFLLVLDSSGEHLKAAVAVGNVDLADHVAVFTPGLTTTVQGSLVKYDRQLAALRQQSDDLAAASGTGTVATVAWLGYEAPQHSDIWRPSRTVLSDENATRGAVRLEAFYDGLDAARTVPAHLTALGHSYGSLTTSLALQRGTGVDDAVVFGSPGLGTSDIADLGLSPGRVFVVEARRDPVADFAAFGIDPNQLDGVTGLSAAAEIIDGVERAESTGHSGYLTDDTTSQYGIAAVVAGLPHLAPRDDGRGFGDLLAAPVPWAQ